MGTSVKLCCSLRWLFGILSESSSLQRLEERKPQKATFRSIFLDPYHHGRLRKELIDLLTDPNLYLSAYSVIFPGEKVENESFECLIHNLAKRGGYVLEDDDVIVNGSMLAQKAPLREMSHLALLDVLMVLYSSNIVTVQRMVKAARRISTFNASKELPNKPEVDLLLVIWLCKVSEAANEDHYSYRRRKKRTKSEGIPSITGDLCCGIRDGQSLAALLLHYSPQSCTWNDFELGNDPLSEKQALKNIQAMCDYCTAHLSPPGFHIPPIDFLQWAESGLLKCNILALLAHLFYSLEVERVMSTLKGSGIPKSSSLISRFQSNNLQSSSEGAIGNRRTGLGEPAMQKRQRPPRRSLKHSQSTTDETVNVLPKLNVSELRTSQARSFIGSKNLDVEATLSGPNADTHMKSTIFEAPLRNSLSTHQASALAAFSRNKISLTKSAHSQSSPLLSVHMPPVSSSSSQNNLISFSVNNLKLEEQMNVTQRKKRTGSFVREQKSTLNNSTVMTGSTAQGLSVSGINKHTTKQDLLEDCNSSKVGTHSLQHEDTDERTLKMSESTKDELTGHQLSMKGSFTVDKHHTFATASAAGLPIVDSKYAMSFSGSSSRDDKMTVTASSSDQSSKTSESSGRMASPERPLAGNNSDVIVLTSFLELHHHHHHHDSAGWKYNTPAKRDVIPPNVRELKGNLMPVLASLQSQNFHMETEVMMQMLKLRSTKKTSKEALVGGNVPASTSLSETAPDSATTAALDREDPKATVSFPSIHSPLKNTHLTGAGYQKITASLEQFERDEHIILQQATLQATGAEASAGETMTPASAAISLKKTDVTLSPSASTRSVKTPMDNQAYAAQPSAFERHIPGQAYFLQPLSQQPMSQNSGKGTGGSEDSGDDSKGGGADGGHYVCYLDGATANINPTNPWVPPLRQNPSTPHMEQLRRKKQKIRQHLEDRDHARRLAAERRKTEKKVDETPERCSSYAVISAPLQLHQHSQQQRDAGGAQALETPQLFTTHEVYSGPDCYIKPKGKSNLKIIRNALCAVCLAGEVNTSLKLKILAELEKTSASHVLILFRDTIGFKFRGIYSYYQGERHIMRICGTGPKEIKDIMIASLYKYNSGQKEFKVIPSRSLSVSVDGLTIKTEYWLMAKRKTLARNQLF